MVGHACDLPQDIAHGIDLPRNVCSREEEPDSTLYYSRA